jgi:hypothetical protein
MSDIVQLSQLMNQLLATEARSVVHHLHGADAPPHLTVKTYPIWRKLNDMVTVSLDHQHQLRAMLGQINRVAVVPTFEQPVAGLHFLSLEHLLPIFIQEKSSQVAIYEKALAVVTTDLQRQMNALLETNRLHLEDLSRSLSQLPDPQTATYSP